GQPPGAYVAPPGAHGGTAPAATRPRPDPHTPTPLPPPPGVIPPPVGVGDTPTLGVGPTDPATAAPPYSYDGESATNITCTGACLNGWSPFEVSAGTTLHPPGGGLTAPLTKVARPGGGYQVAYDGHPLYRYHGDQSAAETNGDGLAGPS